jgi:mono/diheme cytochrome c family protein
MGFSYLVMRTSKQNNSFFHWSVQLTHFLVAAAVSAVVALITLSVSAQTPKATSKLKEETTTTTTAKAEPLSGVELWTMNCSRCHMARNPGEFTAAQWRTVFRHMRIRANLPAAQVRELQKYLESGAGK